MENTFALRFLHDGFVADQKGFSAQKIALSLFCDMIFYIYARKTERDINHMAVRLTSDLHLNHANIISFTERPFDSVEEMNKALLDNFNNVLGVDDTLYILGDVAMGRDKSQTAASFLRQLKCKDVHLIQGNHDPKEHQYMLDAGFKSVSDYLEIPVSSKVGAVLSHYPMLSWNGSCRGHLMLHGHIHSQGSSYNETNRENAIRRYDVGVDANDFCPVSLDEIVAFFQHGNTAKVSDCHGEADFI